MRVRHIIQRKKVTTSDTGWSSGDLPPRHAPIYSKTRPIKAGWKWRSAVADSQGERFILVALCNAKRDNWQSFLMVEIAAGVSVVARFEYHGGHPGLHGHGHCERGGIEAGAIGLDNLMRAPKAKTYHRRVNAWTEHTFWEAARRFFRVDVDRKGERDLFDDAT